MLLLGVPHAIRIPEILRVFRGSGDREPATVVPSQQTA